MIIKTWVNAQPQDSISIFDRGLSFGDGLFETMRVSQGKIPMLEHHMARFQADAEHLGMSFSSDEVLSDIEMALEAVVGNDSSVYRLKYLLTRGESDSGYAPNPRGNNNRIMILQPHDAGLTRLLQHEGVKTLTCQYRLSYNPVLAGIKHLNRLDQVMARQEFLDSECYEGFMLDQAGAYAEGTMSNIFAITSDDEVITPQLSGCGVNGVMKKVVAEILCPAIRKDCHEAEINRMEEFKEVFITNALIGIVPVIAVDNHVFSIGKYTRELQQALKKSQLIE